jgi:hypothetical protein
MMKLLLPWRVEKGEMGLRAGEENQVFHFDDPMGETVGMVVQLFFVPIKMKIRYLNISIKRILKQKMVRTVEPKTNMERMQMI